MPHPPEKIWRALTQGPLIEEWLMKNDFQPVVGQGSISAPRPCRMERRHRLRGAGRRAPQAALLQLERVGRRGGEGPENHRHLDVDARSGGTLVRMEHSGFRPQDERNYQGADYGWQRIPSPHSSRWSRLAPE